MIEINLIKTQVPTQIDLPRKRGGYKFAVIPAVVASVVFFAVLLAGVYFVFIHSNQKTFTSQALIHKKAVKKEQKGNATSLKKAYRKKHKENLAAGRENAKMVRKLKKQVFPVFSINIKLQKIPKPIKKTAQKYSYEELFAKKGNISEKNSTNKKSKNINETRQQIYPLVKIKTKSVFLLKKYLREMNIAYTLKKLVYKKLQTYDIFVGGFDSYPKIVKFARDLKKKGYSLYKIKNIDLLFYVCIDENVDKARKNRYLSVWSKTPFKILTKPLKKINYIYVFSFKCSKKKLNILKKKGYYPIILKSSKIGA